jgi:hypothetical protein
VQLTEIIQLTGLPSAAVKQELEKLILSRGLDPENLSSENIREILAIYMQDTLLGLKEALDESR